MWSNAEKMGYNKKNNRNYCSSVFVDFFNTIRIIVEYVSRWFSTGNVNSNDLTGVNNDMGFQSKFHGYTTMTDGRITVFLEGDFDLSAASEFRAVVEPWLNRKDRVLVLNLRKLKYIDSSGIGFIVSVLKSRNEIGAELVVEEIPSKIKRLLDMTGVTPYLTQ